MIKTALIKALRLLASRWPRTGFGVAVALAWLTQPLGRGVPQERIRDLLPELDARAVRAARRRTATVLDGRVDCRLVSTATTIGSFSSAPAGRLTAAATRTSSTS
jgi:hypothetical protein